METENLIADVDLELSGSYDLDVESVAFDGVTGSANSTVAGQRAASARQRVARGQSTAPGIA
jgi:hypothetical protein